MVRLYRPVLCIIALSYFFITWFPIYLVQARGMNIMQAGFATVAPSLFGLLGGISGGVISDYLIKTGCSYGVGLYFVGAHCIVAALLFLFVMGKIERVGGEERA